MGLTALLVQAVYGVLIIAFAMSRVLWLSDLLLFLTGAALMIVFSTVTSLVQLIAPNEMRGRVMSIYMLAFRGGMPLGSLVSGYLATFIGAPSVIGINGVLLVVVAVYFLLSRPRRPRMFDHLTARRRAIMACSTLDAVVGTKDYRTKDEGL